MKIDVEGTDDGNIKAMYPMNVEMSVLGNKTKTFMNHQGLGVTQIQDGDKKTSTTVLDMTAIGYGIYYRTDTVKKSATTKVECTPDKKDTKNIAGFLCYKQTCVTTDLETDETTTMVCYMSDDFMPNFKSADDSPITGFPLYSLLPVKNKQLDKTYTTVMEVTEVVPSKKVKAVDFLLPEKAVPFSEMPDELKAMMGAGNEEDE
jgi:hypothetical protein